MEDMKWLLKKGGLIFLILLIAVIAAFWGCSVYVSDYKVTKVDTSVSPDKTCELVLQAVGEADFPFGSASGRLVLYEGKRRISKADFELRDDGGCIRSSIWEVTWHEDCVEVILSGDEQIDEQIILYFDGRKEVKQLTDWDRMDDNSGSIEYINQYMIPEQSFDVTLDDWGEVTFVSCKPSCDISQEEYASFFLLRDEQILYKFPYLYEDNTMGHPGSFDNVDAVAFRDINDDGKDDIIVITCYSFGAGPTGMIPRPETRIFLAGDNEFYLAKDIMADLEQHILSQDMTIEAICNYLKNNG